MSKTIDSIKTLKNIHEKFPKLSLDQLLSIMDCIEYKADYDIFYTPTTTLRDEITYEPGNITCTSNNIKL